MKEKIYPRLKSTVRIKKLPSYCWIIEMTEGDGTIIHPLHAFFLSLCDGHFDIYSITQIYAKTFKKEYNQVIDTVNYYLEEYHRYLIWSKKQASHQQAYSPESFLYDIKKDELTTQGRLSSPGSMTLILTHACNFKCIYCFNSSSKAPKNQLNTKEWINIIDQANEEGVVKCTVSGGEPMMHPGIFKILQSLQNHNILIELCSNGSLIDKKVVEKFKNIGMTHVQISLDTANEQTHDKLVAVPGTFKKVTRAIQLLNEAGIIVSVKSVLTPYNISEAEDLIDLCYHLGVKRLVLDRFDLSNAGRGDIELFITREQEIELEKLIDCKKDQLNGEMDVSAVTMPRCWSTEDDVIRCGALLSSLTILPQGDISICEKLIDIPQMTLGNVRQQSLNELWNSNRVLEIVRPPAENLTEPCKSCELLTKCRTGCFAQTLFVSDNPYDADPRCWKAEFNDNPYKLTSQYDTAQ